MTTFVTQRLAGTSAPAVDSGRITRTLGSVRTWGQGYAHAFRAAAAAPRREGIDATVLLMFGRD